MNKKRRPRKLETRITIGIFLTLFSAMIIYLCIYVHNNEQVLMSNSYNSRQKILAKEKATVQRMKESILIRICSHM